MTAELCRRVDLPRMGDSRGNLTFVEGGNHIPFEIKRVYYMYDTEEGVVRGNHAHMALQQLLVAASGSFDVKLDDGMGGTECIRLDRPDQGILLETLVWRQILNFSPGAVCLVLASERYDEADYIRDYQEFLAAVAVRAESD